MPSAQTHIETVSTTARVVAQHPGMRLTATGLAAPHRWITLLILGCCLPSLAAMFALPATMINPEGLGQWVNVVRALGVCIAGLVFWLSLSLLRAWANPDCKGPPFFGFLCTIVILTPMSYGMTNATFLRIFPLSSTYLLHEPLIIQRDYISVSYDGPCRRKCLFEKLTGTDGVIYALNLDNYPTFVAPIVLYEKPAGFRIFSDPRTRPRNPAALTLKGVGNWFGMRIEKITPVKEEQA